MQLKEVVSILNVLTLSSNFQVVITISRHMNDVNNEPGTREWLLPVMLLLPNSRRKWFLITRTINVCLVIYVVSLIFKL